MTNSAKNQETIPTEKFSSGTYANRLLGIPDSGLPAKGFRFVQSEQIQTALKNWNRVAIDDLSAIKRSFQDLVPDCYMPKKFGCRNRRFGEYRLSQTTGEFLSTDQLQHIRKPSKNRLNACKARTFCALQETVRDSLFTRALVEVVVGYIDDPCREWSINIHQFRVDASQGLAHASPNGMHQDGNDYVAIISMGRENSIGGMNQISSKRGRLLFRQTMANDLDCLVLDDRKVLHGVTPILPKFRGAAYSDSFVIDFNRIDK